MNAFAHDMASPPPGLEPVGGAVVLGSGAVEEAVVWQDSTQTYRLQLNSKLC